MQVMSFHSQLIKAEFGTSFCGPGGALLLPTSRGRAKGGTAAGEAVQGGAGRRLAELRKILAA